MERVLAKFEIDLDKAWLRFEQDMRALGRTDEGIARLPKSDDLIYREMKKNAGRLGAATGAAVKRAKRKLVFDTLLELQKNDNIDLTFHSVKNMVGRIFPEKNLTKKKKTGFADKEVLRLFATPGRTAANKTETSKETLAETENQLKKDMEKLLAAIFDKKVQARLKWKDSPARAEILADWKGQRENPSETLISGFF